MQNLCVSSKFCNFFIVQLENFRVAGGSCRRILRCISHISRLKKIGHYGDLASAPPILGSELCLFVVSFDLIRLHVAELAPFLIKSFQNAKREGCRLDVSSPAKSNLLAF